MIQNDKFKNEAVYVSSTKMMDSELVISDFFIEKLACPDYNIGPLCVNDKIQCDICGKTFDIIDNTLLLTPDYLKNK